LNFWESVRVALDGIRANRLRSGLTTLGVMIGIAAVIAVVAIGQGGRAMLLAEMEEIGTNLFWVYPERLHDQPRTGRELTGQDVVTIRELVPEIRYLAPVSSRSAVVRGPRDQRSAHIIGTNADYAGIHNLELKRGRFLDAGDRTGVGGRRVAVLEEELARELFGRQDPLGQRVILRGVPVTVVGILEEKEAFMGFEAPKYVYVPLETWQYAFNAPALIHHFEGATWEREQVSEAMRKTVAILERRHNAPDRYASDNMERHMEAAGQATGIMTLVVGIIAGVSLFVGGIGVMNVMLVSVTERVREIGIRMALGARRRDILVQFLIEAVVLCFLGGLVGMLLGIGGALLIAELAGWPPLISWWTVFLALTFSAAVGLFFGIYPANQAARLDPIEALRRE
jgi:putative ABC transport system permease protein